MLIALFERNGTSFYKKSIQRHTLLKDAVDFVASEVERPADVVIVGSPTRGEYSDVELNDDEDLTENKNTLPDEAAGEIDILFEEEEKKAEVQPPKKKSKKNETNPKWKKLLTSKK